MTTIYATFTLYSDPTIKLRSVEFDYAGHVPQAVDYKLVGLDDDLDNAAIAGHLDTHPDITKLFTASRQTLKLKEQAKRTIQNALCQYP